MIVVDVDRTQIQRFRVARHHLGERLPKGAFGEAADAGIQETTNVTAATAVHARVAELQATDLDRALTADKSLLTVWAMRGAPHVVLTDDAGVFTVGATPVGERSLTTFFGGWAKALSGVGVPLADLVERATEAACEALDGRRLPVDDLRHEIAARMPEIRGLQRPAGAHADLPEPLFRAVGQSGVLCIVDAHRMTDALLARTDQWLGGPPRAIEPPAARAELLRRFLRAYGPADATSFAAWTTRGIADVRDVFAAIESELTEVSVDGAREWILTVDVEALLAAPEPTGVRLLPPRDPFTQQRDRERLLPDAAQRRRLWRSVGSPGLVLVDGRPAGVWTSRRSGSLLDITVEPFGTMSRAAREAVTGEAEAVALLRGSGRSEVSFSRP